MLSGILSSAISGLSVDAQRLAAAADNVANASTQAYKRVDVQSKTLATHQTSSTAYAPGGVLAMPRQLSDVQGLLAASSNPTDLAISGKGYFAVSNGANGETLYTRDGTFTPDSHGDLVNSSGEYLLASAPGTPGAPLTRVNVNTGSVSDVNVSQDGTVTAQFNDGQRRTLATIPVATFTNPQGLQAVSANAFRETGASGPATLRDAGSAGAGSVQSGAVELSTTDFGTEFATMIMAQTSYSASLKVISAAEDMARTLMDVRA